MAIHVNEILNKINNKTITEEEMSIINNVEKFIDSEIIKQLENSNIVHIHYNICNFLIDPSTFRPYSTGKIIHTKSMYEELANRYKLAGWKVWFDSNMILTPNI